MQQYMGHPKLLPFIVKAKHSDPLSQELGVWGLYMIMLLLSYFVKNPSHCCELNLVCLNQKQVPWSLTYSTFFTVKYIKTPHLEMYWVYPANPIFVIHSWQINEWCGHYNYNPNFQNISCLQFYKYNPGSIKWIPNSMNILTLDHQASMPSTSLMQIQCIVVAEISVLLFAKTLSSNREGELVNGK